MFSMTAEEITALSGYLGATPIPEDFSSFWELRMSEADKVPLDYTITQSKEAPSFESCKYLDLWFKGMDGGKIYAKFIKPVCLEPIPLVLQFHGYPGASRSWLEQSSFAGMGMAVIALDCPGQGGHSYDVGAYTGTTVAGHIVAGVDGKPEKMYYVRLYQNVRILCRIIKQLALPEAQYAIYNKLKCKKNIKLYPKYIHERVNFFENEVLGFLKD